MTPAGSVVLMGLLDKVRGETYAEIEYVKICAYLKIDT